MNRSLALLPALLGLAFLGNSARGAIVFNDTFEDGDRTNGVDSQDINWYRANQNLTLGVVPDNFAGGGSVNALNVDIGNIDSLKRIVGQFPAVTLGAAVNDQIKLSFSVKALNSIVTNSSGFRFGLYNSNGTAISADESSTSSNAAELDDYGYNARIPTGALTAPSIFEEPAGDNALGGGTAGTNIVDSTTNTSINDNLGHTIAFTITRTTLTDITYELFLDNVSVASATASSPITTTFDHLYIGSGFFNNFDYRLDNVKLETLPDPIVNIPEPASLSLLALGALTLATKRRRTH